MADITIESSAHQGIFGVVQRAGPFWTSPTVGYVFYVNSLFDLKYRKTSDGGATWGGAVNIRTGSIVSFDCWADWQTAGDAGTKIHIPYIDAGSDDVRYVYLDTNGDSIGGDDQIEAALGNGSILFGSSIRSNMVSVIKTRGGNIAVSVHYRDSVGTHFFSFYTSPDGDTWTSRNSPWEAVDDFLLLFPGNEADNQDLWATFWDRNANELSLKTFDNSANSWSEQLISGSMAEHTSYLQMNGAIRLSDGHLIFAAWNLYDNADADLMVWDINGAGSIVAKTNVKTNAAEYYTVSVFINHVNDDIYVAYIGGTAIDSFVAAFYKKSVDGGDNWGGETALQADEEDDESWISAGAMKAAWGGKFQPCWHNKDLYDLFTNVDNGISITAPIDLPTVTAQAATNKEDTTATTNGNITDNGGEDCDKRGVVYDTSTHADPGDVAPGASGYASFAEDTGTFGVGAFTKAISSLPPGTTIYYRMYAHNSEGYDFSNTEITFLTKLAAPTNVQATDGTYGDKVRITWTKSTGATGYRVYRDSVDVSGLLGDVATYDDSGASAGTITPGTASASDGTSAAHVTLSLAGESVANGTTHTYKVVAVNATGNSDDSSTNTGYRGTGSITYQWQRSAADSDASYSNIGEGTTDPYNDTGAPSNGDGRYFQCVLSATGTSNQTSTADRGYRSASRSQGYIIGCLLISLKV